MVQIKCLSNGLYSLKNSHIPFGKGFQSPPYSRIPFEHHLFSAGASLGIQRNSCISTFYANQMKTILTFFLVEPSVEQSAPLAARERLKFCPKFYTFLHRALNWCSDYVPHVLTPPGDPTYSSTMLHSSMMGFALHCESASAGLSVPGYHLSSFSVSVYQLLTRGQNVQLRREREI